MKERLNDLSIVTQRLDANHEFWIITHEKQAATAAHQQQNVPPPETSELVISVISKDIDASPRQIASAVLLQPLHGNAPCANRPPPRHMPLRMIQRLLRPPTLPAARANSPHRWTSPTAALLSAPALKDVNCSLNALANYNVCELDDFISLFNASIITSLYKFNSAETGGQAIRAKIKDRDEIFKHACERGSAELLAEYRSRRAAITATQLTGS
ncbi:hypothetical protein TSAR_014434 [Trichomalopsis sarcophagae]|uniref:Uncharacterized protein n=1 Tax=Trichomalopsis sarcophagae TaxID=543379 RepID=A0A232FEW8_9HYME|nr:hypothetical protein TSAR_014434 [Trichomalopsis sarcophagae]